MNTTGYKKIILYFLLGIGLPSIIMGYLALRGIQNDRALLEKERAVKYTNLANKIKKSLQNYLSEREQLFLKRFNSLSKNNQLTIDRLDLLLRKDFPNLNCFVFENFSTIRFSDDELLYVNRSKTNLNNYLSLYQSESDLTKKALEYEFKHKSFSKAIDLYKKALEKSDDKSFKAKLICNIARLQKKSGNYSEAAKTYRNLIKNYGTVPLSNGIPAGPVCGLELCRILKERRNFRAAIQTIFSLYEELLKGTWAIDESQYEFLSKQSCELIGQLLPKLKESDRSDYSTKFKNLFAIEDKKRKLTKKLLNFQKIGEQYLSEYISRMEKDPKDKPFHRFVIETGGKEPYLVILLNQKNSGRIWGIILDRDNLESIVLPKIINHNISNAQITWQLKNNKGETILKSDKFDRKKQELVKTVVCGFPPVSIDLLGEHPQLFKSLFLSRHSTYFYIFILVGTIFLFGIFLTFTTINHEMALTKTKSDLASAVSHEFKNPLTSIRQLTEMLQLGRVASNERKQHYYQVILEQCDRLKLMVNNILDFSKLEKGSKVSDLKMVNISQFIHEIITQVQRRVSHKGFRIMANISTDLPYMKIDEISLEQAIINLIDNGIKFSGDKKLVEVSTYCEKDELIISVKDYGVGIPKNETKKIFTQFYRSKTGSKNVKGSGLGLTIVKQIVESHKGTVDVVSKPGHGSTFFIRLPLPK